MSVNLSSHLVTDRTLPADVTTMLADRQLDGDALVLEVTEAAVTTDPEAAEKVLRGLRAIGVRIVLDDFGSGYASVKALHGIALDGVKIDRDLVNDCTPAGQDLLAATMNMARLLGLSIVAKGIENQAGLDSVRRHGADRAQGYHLARPMSPDAIGLLVSNGRAPREVTATERP